MKVPQAGLRRFALAAAVSLCAVTVPIGVMAQDKIQDQTKDQDRLQTQDRTQDMIYGSQLMTQTERDQYRAQMRKLQTAQEREAFRLQHHEQMQERARVKGVVLPVEPPSAGAGPAGGMRGGAGAADGQGSGKKYVPPRGSCPSPLASFSWELGRGLPMSQVGAASTRKIKCWKENCFYVTWPQRLAPLPSRRW